MTLAIVAHSNLEPIAEPLSEGSLVRVAARSYPLGHPNENSLEEYWHFLTLAEALPGELRWIDTYWSEDSENSLDKSYGSLSEAADSLRSEHIEVLFVAPPLSEDYEYRSGFPEELFDGAILELSFGANFEGKPESVKIYHLPEFHPVADYEEESYRMVRGSELKDFELIPLILPHGIYYDPELFADYEEPRWRKLMEGYEPGRWI